MKIDLQACPCCGAHTITEQGEYDICEKCGWEDDPIQLKDPNYEGGANSMSLNQARMKWSNR